MDECQNGYFREDFEILLKVTDFENLTLKKCCSIFLFFANETFWKIWSTFLQKCLLSIVHTKLPKNLVSKTLVLAKSFVRRIFLQKIQNYFCLTEICKMYYPFTFLIYLHVFYQIIWIRLLGLGLPEILQKHNHLACLTEIKKILIRFFCILQYAIGSYHAFSGLDMNFASFCHP